VASEAFPETSTWQPVSYLVSELVGSGPDPALVSVSASRAVHTAANPASVPVRAFCETGAVRAGMKPSGVWVVEELASEASLEILAVGC